MDHDGLGDRVEQRTFSENIKLAQTNTLTQLTKVRQNIPMSSPQTITRGDMTSDQMAHAPHGGDALNCKA